MACTVRVDAPDSKDKVDTDLRDSPSFIFHHHYFSVFNVCVRESEQERGRENVNGSSCSRVNVKEE